MTGADDPNRDAVLKDLLEVIDVHGWCVRHVLAGELAEEVQFTYTIGLTAMGHPEVVVTGLPSESAHIYLNNVGSDVSDGKRYAAGDSTDEWTRPGAPVLFLAVDDTSGLAAIEQVYGHVDALQLVWPDSAGRMPWDPGCTNPPHVQPLLGPHPGDAP